MGMVIFKLEKKMRRKIVEVKEKTDFITETASHVIGYMSLQAERFELGCAVRAYHLKHERFIDYKEILKERAHAGR